MKPIALLLAAALATPSWGAYPDRPITLIVPFPPGGATDLAARILAKGLAPRLGQPVVVDNRAGAGTAIGAAALARAPADGYTLMLSTTSTFTIAPAVKPGLAYDPQKFEAIGIVGTAPLALLATAPLPAATIADVVALSRRLPGTLAYASFGAGTSSHFGGEIFKRATGADLLHVPYKGSAPALQALISGQVQLAVDTVVAAQAQHAPGRIKAIAVMAGRRASALPNVPTVAESGYPGFAVEPWAAVVAPRGLSREVQQTLVKALAVVMADPAVRADLTRAGIDFGYEPPHAYEARLSRELPLMRAQVRESRITPE